MALTYNIHYGLAAWASGSFTLGQRCSNAGNAYQCVTAGTSSAAPTGTGSTINNGGTAVFKWLSTVDYTTLQLWANALPATLTQPITAQLWNDAPITTTSGTPFLTLTGHATTSVNTITITCAPGESFAGVIPNGSDPFSTAFSAPFGSGPISGGSGASNALAFNSANGVSFVLPATGAGNTSYFLIQDNYVTINGLQFQDPNSSSNSSIIKATQTCTVQGCILDGYGQSNTSLVVATLGGATTSKFSLINSLLVDRAVASTGSTVSSNYNATYANNTIVALNAPTGLGGIVDRSTASGVSVKIINSILIGYTAANTTYTLGSAAIAVSYDIISASAFTGAGVTVGTNNQYNATAAALFVSATADFRLLLAASAVNAGYDDLTDIPAAIDIFSTPRPQSSLWDIGAYEHTQTTSYGVAAGKAAVAGYSSPASIGAAAGKATVVGTAGTVGSVGTAAGAAVVAATATTVAIGTAMGVATVAGYDQSSSIGVVLSVNNPGTQVVGTAFTVSGTYTLTPSLLFADDSNATFTSIPASGISPLGSTNFSFTHPGDPSTGQQNLLIEDVSTAASTSVNYSVVASPPPPSAPAISYAQPFSAGSSLSALATTLPAYIYQEYADDDNVQAFAAAYNQLAQGYLDWFNTINLPVYTGPLIVGALLDWVGQGVYGISRPVLALSVITATVGDFNTYDLNTIDLNGSGANQTSNIFPVTDDVYKRILTWFLYKGDGFQFNVMWLKRRIARFLAGVNGTDYTGPTDQISVAFNGTTSVTITLNTGSIPLTMAPVFQAAVLTQAISLPFQYNFNILIN